MATTRQLPTPTAPAPDFGERLTVTRRLIAGVEVRLIFDGYRVEKFGPSPHVAICTRGADGCFLPGWIPQAVWDAAPAVSPARSCDLSNQGTNEDGHGMGGRLPTD
jgi:hypothetical protein